MTIGSINSQPPLTPLQQVVKALREDDQDPSSDSNADAPNADAQAESQAEGEAPAATPNRYAKHPTPGSKFNAKA